MAAKQARQLIATDGTVYEVNKRWPNAPEAANSAEELLVGAILLRDENSFGSPEGVGTEHNTTPAFYSIWALTPVLGVALLAQQQGMALPDDQEFKAALARALAGEITQRVIYPHEVKFVDVSWRAQAAIDEIIDHLSDEDMGGEEDENEEVQAAPGNGQVQAPSTTST